MESFDLNASQKTKSTPIGAVPVDWGCVPLGDIVSRAQYGLSLATQPTGNTRIVKMDSMVGGRLSLIDLDRVECSPEDAFKYRIRRGDILFNRTNSLAMVGKTVVAEEDTDAVFASYIVRFQLDASVDPYFVGYWFNSELAQSKMKTLATVGVSQSNINPTRLQVDFLVPVPPLNEQRKIVSIMSDWDKFLEKLIALIEAKGTRRRALLQQFLTGKIRVKDFDHAFKETKSDRYGVYPADWKKVRLGDVTHESNALCAEDKTLPVLSCTKYRGLVRSDEYFGRRVYSEDTGSYRLVKRGEFAYATNHIEEGSIGYQDLCDAGLVSPIYTVFRTTEGIDDRFFFRLLKSPLLVHLYRANTSASVDRRGSLRYEEFANIQVWLPQKEEQSAIADIFDTYDDELHLLRAQRTAVEQQKRGLMQRLLTGKIRVKADHPTS